MSEETDITPLADAVPADETPNPDAAELADLRAKMARVLALQERWATTMLSPALYSAELADALK